MHGELKCWVCICEAGAVTPLIQICKYWFFALGFLKAHWWMPFLGLPFIYAQCRIFTCTICLLTYNSTKTWVNSIQGLHLPCWPCTLYNVGKLRSLLEIKLNLVPVRLGKHLRCISVRQRKDRTLSALHHRWQGPEHRELLQSMQMWMVSTFMLLLLFISACRNFFILKLALWPFAVHGL